MPRRKTSVGFIGYVRVSTERLMDDGEGLRAQTLKLEEYARGLDMEIEIVPASEPGHGPITARPRYREAIQKAEQLGWKLLVVKPCRLSRDVQHIKPIDLRRTPIWICGEGLASKERLLEGIKAAALELKQLRSDGHLGALKRAAGQRTTEAETNAHNGRAAGGKANGDRVFRNRLRVIDYLEQNAGASALTHRELVDALNTSGILNCVSERKRTYKPWTAQALRPVRKDAMLQIQLDAEPD